MYEGVLKVIGDFSAVLPICGGLMLFCWKSEAMTDLMRNTESFSSRFFLKVHFVFFFSLKVKCFTFLVMLVMQILLSFASKE